MKNHKIFITNGPLNEHKANIVPMKIFSMIKYINYKTYLILTVINY